MRAAICLLLLAAATPAAADCNGFKWSVARERAWLAAPTPLPASGATAEAGKGYALTLAKDATLPVAPERAPKAGTYAAVVSAPGLAAGTYQITLSEEAWIDVAQDGKIVKSRGFSGQKDCPGVRKSVRFPLSAGVATIEISNARTDRIDFAIAPASP